MANTGTHAELEVNQETFKETPYQDASWEVVSELDGEIDFQPLELQAISDNLHIDPMFANYGGVADSSITKRWHLPEDVKYKSREEKLAEEELNKEEVVTLSAAELEDVKRRAFEDGQSAALAAATEEHEKQCAQITGSLHGVLTDLQAQMQEQVARVEQEAVALTMLVAKKIIDAAVEINPEYLLSLIRQALGNAGSAKVQKVKVSAQDLEFLEVVGAAKMLKEFDGTWTFEADESVRAGCIVETTAGEIDFNVDSAFDRVKDLIIKAAR